MSEEYYTAPFAGWTRRFESRHALEAYSASIDAAIGLLQDWGAAVHDGQGRKYAKYPCPAIPGQLSCEHPTESVNA